MFERFTDKARRSLVAARLEARDLGSPVIGSEHVLLGLATEEQGVAAKVMAGFGLNAGRLREELDATGGAGPEKLPADPPFSPGAKRALEASLQESIRLGHNYIGTEHVLLGLVAEGGAGAELLSAHGADADSVTASVLRALGNPPRSPSPSALRAAPHRARLEGIRIQGRRTLSAALADSVARARKAKDTEPTTTTDAVAAILDDDRAQATIALAALGVTRATFLEAAEQIPLDDTSDGPPLPTAIELKLGSSRTVIEDPQLAAFLARSNPEDIRRALRQLVEGE